MRSPGRDRLGDLDLDAPSRSESRSFAQGSDRAHVRAYATWQVAQQLAHTSHSGHVTPAAQKYARSLVSEAIKLVRWLHDQRLELGDLRQDLVDAWITAGAATRRRVRLFLRWLARAGVTGPLHFAWNTLETRRGPLDDHHASTFCAASCTTTQSMGATGSPAVCCCSTPNP